MYREMGNGGAWRGTEINYVVITSSFAQKKQVAINISLLCHYCTLTSCYQQSRFRYSDRLVRIAMNGGFKCCGLNVRKAERSLQSISCN